MSFLTPKPTKDGASSLPAQARRPATSPVFKPEFLRSLRMHSMLAACVAVAVCALMLAYALRQKSVYEAESLVYVEPSAVKPLTDDAGGAFDASRYDSYLSQQIQTAGRLDILLAAVHTLPLGTWQMPGESDVSAATRLQNAVKVERVLTSYQLSFTLRGGNPVNAARTLNAVVAAYLAAGRKDELAEVDQRAQILGEERQRLGTELAQDRTEQAQLAASLGMANPGAESDNPYDAQLSGLRSELASAREAHDIAAAQLGSVSGADTAHASGLASAADELIAGDAGLSSMRATISQRRATLTGQMAGLKPENPVYRQDQEELADLDRTQDAMTREMRDKAARRLQDKLHTDLTRTGDVEARLNGELARQTSLATGAAPRLQRASELAGNIQRLSTRYATVDNNLRSLQLESTGPGLARLALAASPPLAPLPSRRNLIVAAALPVGLVCGVFAAVFARKRDKRLYIGRDLDETLGFTPIAVLPAAEDVSARAMREYMLRLAGGIESAYRIHGARTFVLTAPSRGAGLRSISVPLGSQLEQLGLQTITVSAPEVLHGSFAGEPESGNFALQVTEPARDAKGRREGFAALNLDRLKTTHDLVFVESPPLLTSAETEYLVRSVDATILFVESGVTTRGELLQAALLLEQLQVKGIGTVLEGLHLRYADPGFKRALAELESRHADEPEVPGAQAAKTNRGERTPAAASVAPVAVPIQGEAQAATAEAIAEPADTFERVPKPVAETGPVISPTVVPGAATPAAEESLAHGAEASLPAGLETLTSIADLTADLAPVVATPAMLPVTSCVAEAARSESFAPEADPMKRTESESLLRIAPDRDGAMAPLRTETASRRRQTATPEGEPSRGWLSRLLHRDSAAAVSIIPDDDDEDEEGVQAAPASIAPSSAVEANCDLDAHPEVPAGAVSAAPAQPVALGGETPVVAHEAGGPASHIAGDYDAVPSEWMIDHSSGEHVLGNEPLPVRSVALTTPEPTPVETSVPAPPRPPVRLWEQHDRNVKVAGSGWPSAPAASNDVPLEALSKAEPPAPRPPTHFEPLFGSVASKPASLPAPQLPTPRSQARMAVRVKAVPMPAAAPVEPPAVTPAVAPAPPVAAAPASTPAAPAPARPAPWRDEQEESFRSGRFETPLRTGRWEPIPPLRAQATPWRDRRVAGSDAHILPQEDRRFRQAPTGIHSAPATPPARVEQHVARPQLVQREPRLSRRWGLLSQFAEGEPGARAAQPEENREGESLGYDDDTFRGEQRAAGGTRRP